MMTAYYILKLGCFICNGNRSTELNFLKGAVRKKYTTILQAFESGTLSKGVLFCKRFIWGWMRAGWGGGGVKVIFALYSN